MEKAPNLVGTKNSKLGGSLCIIPARGNSKRFPKKNIALLGGKPLLVYSIEVAIESHIFDTICVSSENEEILSIAESYGVEALKRPADLSTDFVGCNKVCLHILEHFICHREYTSFAVLWPTSPLRTTVDIREAYDILKKKDVNYVVSLIPYSHPPLRAVWVPNGYVEPYFEPKYMEMKQSQLFETLYRHDGTIIFAKTEVFLKEKEFYGTNVVPYFTPVERAVDIDTPMDLAWAEFLLSYLPHNSTHVS